MTSRAPFSKNRRLLLAATGAAIGGAAVAATPKLFRAPASPAPRILTVYFSRTGHTRSLAQMIHSSVGGDIARVETVKPYPENYEATVEQARDERDSGSWPAVRSEISDINGYDLIFLGSPVWGDHLNPPMKRWLADHDLSGKAIAPFVTYIVSRMGQVPTNISNIASRARLLDGLAVLGEETANADGDVERWLRGIEAIRRTASS